MAQFDQPHLLAPNRKETKKEEQLTHVTGCDNNSGLLTFHPHSWTLLERILEKKN